MHRIAAAHIAARTPLRRKHGAAAPSQAKAITATGATRALAVPPSTASTAVAKAISASGGASAASFFLALRRGSTRARDDEALRTLAACASSLQTVAQRGHQVDHLAIVVGRFLRAY